MQEQIQEQKERATHIVMSDYLSSNNFDLSIEFQKEQICKKDILLVFFAGGGWNSLGNCLLYSLYYGTQLMKIK